uniref:NADH-ubiquinone oxidoreductase chain 4 n=1 Tax=Ovatella vulcani TaxID=999270 RepID=G8HPA6_9EUPU|nr:NADH dehydrogenase subunit 4 [Ovatella vulcani]AEQ93849.1 NADH dehydrogenase subunit 4 [Ovatella vulcani]
MLSIVFGLAACACMSYWGVVSIGSGLVSVVALGMLYQSFTTSTWGLGGSSGVSSLLVFLSVLLCFLAFISTPEEKEGGYLFWISVLGLVLVGVFFTNNVIWFYIFFEMSLIPTLILIIGWGYQPERLQAGSYLMLYTVSASLPLLVLLIWRSADVCTSGMPGLLQITCNVTDIMTLVAYGAFLVKLPMYSLHLWLPKAHVEAPLAGSMILAGILLKLGGYGLMQMNKGLSIGGGGVIVFVLVALSMWGGLLATIMCLRQVDMKALVAYSSVGHMGIVSAGVLLDRTWGVASATVTMLAHGLSSSAMFCLAYFSYQKSHTRSLSYLGGYLSAYPPLSLFWFLFCCINMAAPPTLNLLGELAILPSLWSSHIALVFVMGLMVFFSAAYNMYLYVSVNHGSLSQYCSSGAPLLSYQALSLVLHAFPLLFVLKSQILLT